MMISTAFALLTLTVPAEACPDLFGDAQTQQHSAEMVRYQVHSVVPLRKRVTLFHGVGAWHDVKTKKMQGMEVLRTEPNGEARLSITTDNTTVPATCRGEHSVSVGTPLGPDRRVVAVLDGGIMVGGEREVFFWPTQGATRTPKIELIWQSGYHLMGATAQATDRSYTSARSKSGADIAAPMQRLDAVAVAKPLD